MKKIVVFGNSGFAEHIYYLLKYDSQYEVAAFTVDRKYIRNHELCGLHVIPFEEIENTLPPSEYGMSIPISFQKINRLREEKYLQAKAKGYELISFYSSRATLYPGFAAGDNCIVLEQAIIAPSVEIGNDVIIASGAIIGHHAVIKDHCFISPGAVILGGVVLEEYCLIGANATIKEEARIGRECLIGSGVSITRDTVDKGVYINPPAELYPKRSDELRTWLMWPVREHKTAPAGPVKAENADGRASEKLRV